MAVEDIENKVRKMSSQKPEDGKDLQQLQEAQNQIVQINAERQGNLQTARLENNADAANNETMSQAVEMAALGGLGGAAVQQQVQAMNPQTQAVLGKYGLGQPKVQRTSSRSVQVTPQKITINNNTTNTTTNNVAVPAANVGGPVQGRTLAIKQNPDESQARFKTWIANAFAKQNQQAAVREKEYQRREWSLTRSTNKLMKHLSDLGKSVSERLDPRKLSSSVGSQFKTILFLFGTMFLAKHWKRIIRFAGNVETFFFGEPNPNDPKAPRGRSGFSKMLISLFGGDPEGKAGVIESLGKLFWNDNKDGVLQLLGDKISNFFKERGDAIKAIKVPELDLGNLPDTVTKLIEYLGNILKAGFGGADAIKDIVSSNIKQVGKESSMASEAIEGRTFKSAKGINVKDISWGDATTVSKPGSNGYLNSWDISSDNKITNTAGEVRQAGTISRMLNDKTSNTVNVAGVMSGMERLKNTADTKGGVLISEDFISGLRNLIDTKGLFGNEDLSIKRFKFVKREKTDDDYYKEGADWKRRSVEGFAKRSVVNAGRKVVGADGMASDIGDAIITGDIIQDPTWKAISEGIKGSWNKAWADKYTLDMVPLNDPRQGEVLEVEEYDGPEYNVDPRTGVRKKKKVNKSVFEFYEATPSFFEKVRAKLGEKLNNENFEFSTSDETSLKQMEDLMTQVKRKQLEDNKKYFESHNISFDPIIKNIHSDINIDKQFEGYHNAIKESEKRDEEFDKKYENSPMKRGINYVSEGVSNVVDSVKGSLGISGDSLERGDFVRKMREAYSKKFKELGIDEKYIDYMIAQDAQESSWGTSNLATKKNNFGGIKDGNGWRKFESIDDYVDYKVNLLNKEQYGYNAFNGDDIDTVMKRVASKYDPGNDKYVGRWKDTYNSVSRIKPLSTEEIKSLRNQGKYQEADLASSSWERIEDVLKAGGVTDFVVTSKKRKPGEAGNSGNKSYHTTDNLAIDIVPTDGDFERLKQQLLSSPLVQEYFQRRGLGILDETTKEALAKTGGTGAHYHIGPDNASVNTWLAWNKDFESSSNNDGVYYADNYVEKKTDKGFNIPTYNWGESGSNSSSSAVLMAQSNVLAPEKVTPTTSRSSNTIPGNTSESAAKELVADAGKDRTEDIYSKVSDVNENIKLLQKTSIAQAEAINNVSTAIASLKFNTTPGWGGDNRTKVTSSTQPPYHNG